MAINVELRKSNGSTYSGSDNLIYLKTHYDVIDGLKDAQGIILSDKLPYASVANAKSGKVILSINYNPETPGDHTALAQAGAKGLYNDLMNKIRNLESPIDFMTNMTVSWGASKTYTQINADINTYVQSLPDAPYPHPGSAVLINNKGSGGTYFIYIDEATGIGVEIDTRGYWLWIYDGTNWKPAIDFPEVPSADWSGANLVDMVEGMITKAMIWKLKGLKINGVLFNSDGVATIDKTHIGLGNVDNTKDADKSVAYAANAGTAENAITAETSGTAAVANVAVKLQTARTIAGASFDGTKNIDISFNNIIDKPYNNFTAIPFNNLVSVPEADIGEKGIVEFLDPTGMNSTFYSDMTPYWNKAMGPISTKNMINALGSIPIVSSIAAADALPRAKVNGSLVFVEI